MSLFFKKMKQLVLILFCATFLSSQAQSFESKEVTCVSDSLHLKGTLTYPSADGKYPVLLLISGTGPQDRNGAFAGHKPFQVMAETFTAQGYAVLRMDDRGVGESEGIYEEATTSDFVQDVLAELALLKNFSFIDTTKMGLLGHSEGGAVAFQVAAQSADVSFVISLAGLAIDGYTSLLLQNEAILHSASYIKPCLVDEYMDLYSCLFSTVKETPRDSLVTPYLEVAFNHWLSRQEPDSLQAMNMVGDSKGYFIRQYMRIAESAWYREMIAYDPSQYLPQITIPVLALNGDKDIMVTPDENLASLDSLLSLAGNTQYKLVRMPGHNHMFQECIDCNRKEMGSLPEAISQATLDTLSVWLEDLLLKN